MFLREVLASLISWNNQWTVERTWSRKRQYHSSFLVNYNTKLPLAISLSWFLCSSRAANLQIQVQFFYPENTFVGLASAFRFSISFAALFDAIYHRGTLDTASDLQMSSQNSINQECFKICCIACRAMSLSNSWKLRCGPK